MATSVRGGVTDNFGFCNILALAPVKIFVRLSHTAFQPLVFENVLMQLGKTISLGKIRLLQRTLDMPELVILGERPSIDPSSTTYGYMGFVSILDDEKACGQSCR